MDTLEKRETRITLEKETQKIRKFEKPEDKNKEKTDQGNRKIEMACITCPMSCHLVVELDEAGGVLSVTGNTCKRGENYARNELTHPMRMLTSTVKINNAMYPRLPVILSGEIPKDRIFDVMKAINTVSVCAPIGINDIIVENVCGLGVNVIASRSMKNA